ncbi:MAG: helix-turn-helix domain-containing protein [Firmicutes bacterium]|nr:helix-turn-helix domain-containing protein [Bacillota bacterium]
MMFHRALFLEFKEGTAFELTFLDGKVMRYDMAWLFSSYPQLKDLENRELFLSGKLMGSYGVIWNEDLDIEAETVYEEGEFVRTVEIPARYRVGQEIAAARAQAGMTQAMLSDVCGIDQSDLSKLERGQLNPSVTTLERIAKAVGGTLEIHINRT